MGSTDTRSEPSQAAPASSCRDTQPAVTSEQIRTYQRQLRRLASELSLAEARERREIASDLHDHIGQALAYVAQKVGTLKGNAVFSGMEADFAEIVSLLNQTIRYTRDLTGEISPPVLYELGLPAAIDWLAERALQRHGLRGTARQTGSPQEIADDIKVFMFKAIQELITNVAKHAHASEVSVRTVWRAEVIEIQVEDDGCGFDTDAFEHGIATGDCFGLFSIRERLSYVGGTITIASSPGQGTRIRMTTPYRIRPKDGDD